ncbi:MAG: hopanoid biosynthesis-associated protein HpnK [Hyphomicrobiales bacterium]|nr:hopanoid biosynthesis-associated protein HpnK [Hyphomicrobiales bacterium]
MSFLVVTADDFGLALEVNEAVEIAHRKGILSAASLMVAGRWAADAVRRARAMPRLRVGLHLAVTDARPALPPEAIPALFGREGRLSGDLVALGVRLALSGGARRQMRAEIEAQFSAFRATGLPLDHVTVHQHFHLHPVVAAMVIEIGDRYGARAVRTPLEPHQIVRDVDQLAAHERRLVEGACAALLKAKAERAGWLTPDGVFGLRWSGRITAERLSGLIARIPTGFWEIYTHPATQNEFAGGAPGYRYAEELAALIAPETLAALHDAGHSVGGYEDAGCRRQSPFAGSVPRVAVGGANGG